MLAVGIALAGGRRGREQLALGTINECLAEEVEARAAVVILTVESAPSLSRNSIGYSIDFTEWKRSCWCGRGAERSAISSLDCIKCLLHTSVDSTLKILSDQQTDGTLQVPDVELDSVDSTRAVLTTTRCHAQRRQQNERHDRSHRDNAN